MLEDTPGAPVVLLGVIALDDIAGAEVAVECNLSGGAHIGRVRDLVPTIP